MNPGDSPADDRPHLQVVAAVIADGGRFLCTQRGTGPLAGRWEFPGGKIDPGESPEQALAREITEELGCTITVGALLETTTHAYEFAVITLASYLCTLAAGRPRLTEHSAARWLTAGEMDQLDWAPADLPTVRALQRASVA